LRRLKVGDDAIVRVDAFSLTGKSAKSLRSKLNQLEKLGIRAQSYTPPIADRVLDQARSVSDEWLTIPGRRERQFTLGRFNRDYLRSTEILAAEDDSGRMLGFLNFIPSYRPGEATLDLMRRRTEGPNGIMDYLFIQAFLIARQRGFERVNLGMAPMSGFLPGEQASPDERAIHAFFQKLNFVFSFGDFVPTKPSLRPSGSRDTQFTEVPSTFRCCQ
jgi:phosphatidylglycerol lysyltransferase